MSFQYRGVKQELKDGNLKTEALTRATEVYSSKKLADTSFSDPSAGPNGGGGPTGKTMSIDSPNAFASIDTGANGSGGPKGPKGLEPVSTTFKTGPNGGGSPANWGKVNTKLYGEVPHSQESAAPMGASPKVNVGPNGGGTGPSGKAMGDV